MPTTAFKGPASVQGGTQKKDKKPSGRNGLFTLAALGATQQIRNILDRAAGRKVNPLANAYAYF